MATLTLEPTTESKTYMPAAIEKVSIVISKGSLDGVYPGLIMANGARAEGIEANLFFTFFGLDAIHKARHEHIKIATVGNPGLHLSTWLGGVPGMSSVMTHYLASKMEKIDIPTIPEFIEMIADTGCGLFACKSSVDLFGLAKEDFIPEVHDIITVGEFYEKAAGSQSIYTRDRNGAHSCRPRRRSPPDRCSRPRTDRRSTTRRRRRGRRSHADGSLRRFPRFVRRTLRAPWSRGWWRGTDGAMRLAHEREATVAGRGDQDRCHGAAGHDRSARGGGATRS